MTRPVHVAGYGVFLPSGETTGALLSACLAGVSAINVIKDLAVAVGNDYRAHLPRLACLPDTIAWEESLQEVLQALLALPHPVLLITPDNGAPQWPWIENVLSQVDPQGRCQRVAETGMAEVLVRQVARLRAGEIDGLSVLGVDSLTHPVTVMDLAAAGALQTDKLPDGRAAGEGFAWFTLSAGHGPVGWQSEAAGVEPYAGAMQPPALQGLSDTLQALSQKEAMPRPRIIVHARAQTPQDDLEWHHASQRLWPSRLPPRDNLAMRKGEHPAPQPATPPWQQHFKPANVVGEVGAAGFPMAVALACERLCWPLVPVDQTLIVDAGVQQARCAVLLKQTESQGCDSNE